ncbi:NUDIX hydrolase [Candidatus Bathyarchaeota archaeon]|nr:NUDIX hydrolase [Candidatus Bathyarchaeota archaeon]MBS7630055.1 NUDIX hydrolase [Candidatus Bathyarchaeota archaeon]
MNREYPSLPIPGVAAIIVREEAILLVKREHEPSKGVWGLPGGVVELGETIEEAVCREVKEETGIEIQPIKLLKVLDSITRDESGKIRFHYVLFEFLCKFLGGELKACTDAQEAMWVSLDNLDSISIMPWTRRFIDRIYSDLKAHNITLS